VAAGHSLEVDPARWQAGLGELLGRVAGRFGRGGATPAGQGVPVWAAGRLATHELLDDRQARRQPQPGWDAAPAERAVWDHDGVRDDLRDYLVEHLGDPEAVLVIDETGDRKKDIQSVGVQRQFTGTAGRIKNAQVAAYLLYATDAGHAMIDRELYVPRGWIHDPNRCQAAGIPEQVGFATKPALAPACSLAPWTPAGDAGRGANPGEAAQDVPPERGSEEQRDDGEQDLEQVAATGSN
jgi:hypothetical protein